MHNTPRYQDSRQGNRFPIIPWALLEAAIKNQKHELARQIVTMVSVMR